MKRAEITELILPAKQARSQATRDRLMAAGRRLLERDAFEATSIADIARAAGCSVGVFYYRFPSKEAFFTVVIEAFLSELVADAEEAAAAERALEGSIDTTLAHCALYWVGLFRRHRGLLRTVMKKTLHSEDTWTPFLRMGRAAAEPFISLLLAKCDESDGRLFHYRALIGFQIISGVALNASLHKTVLLNLDSSELIGWATEILRHCLFGDILPALLEFAGPSEYGPLTNT